MKSRLLFLISFFVCQTLFAQTNPGIAVQGIARDANKAALVDELLTFTFEVQDPDGKPKYSETVDIRTDPYGVFSHIIGTGTPQGSGLFGEIPFGQAHMKLVISVTYDGENIKLSDAPFQYAPYAKSAENGVPTGTIVAFAGQEANIPKGWVLCDGRSLTTIDFSQNLRDLIGDKVPDLRGMFLRGAGKNSDPVFDSNVGPELNTTQEDSNKEHTHPFSGTTTEDGAHWHKVTVPINTEMKSDDANDRTVGTPPVGHGEYTTTTNGNHTHNFTGVTGTSGTESRPVNYGVNYIIKL